MPPLAQKKPAPSAHRVILSAHCGPVKSSRHWHERSGFSSAAPVLHGPSFRHCEGRVTHARVSFAILGTRKGQAFVRSCARVGPASRVRRIPTGQGWNKEKCNVSRRGRTLCPAKSPVQSTQESNSVLFKSPSLQLDAEAEASDTASSVASNVRRRVIVREDLQDRRQAPPETSLRRSHRSSVKLKPNSRPARSSDHPVDRPDRPLVFTEWCVASRTRPHSTARPTPVAWLRVGGRRSTRARKVRGRSIGSRTIRARRDR